jgi:hypothetical protein
MEDVMKTRIVVGLMLILLLAACKTVPIQPATATEADPASAYIQAVEDQAFGSGTRVIWVHPPDNKDLVKKEG